MKPFTVLTCAQRSDEWRQARAGIFTASRAGEVFERTQKGLWTAKRKDYRTELVVERVTGRATEDRFAGKMPRIVRDGQEREPLAIRHHENVNGVVVRSCGFVLDNEIAIGCSPDGVLGDFEGLIQVKCPKASTHYAMLVKHRQWLDADKHGGPLQIVPDEYQAQVMHELYCTGAMWEDFISYHPDFPPAVRSLTIRVMAADCMLPEYGNDVRVFLDEVEAECETVAKWMAA